MTQEGKLATCQDFIEEGKWVKHFCCEDCHAKAVEQGDKTGLVETTIFDKTLNWNSRRPALLCCHAAILLDPRNMPSHEWEDVGEEKGVQLADCSNGKGDAIALCVASPNRENQRYRVSYYPEMPGHNSVVVGFESADKDAATSLYNALQRVSKFIIGGKYVTAREIDPNYESDDHREQ